ncbi:hypothetical protein BIW11_06026, partial [Tropilaelaps mercedesae]
MSNGQESGQNPPMEIIENSSPAPDSSDTSTNRRSRRRNPRLQDSDEEYNTVSSGSSDVSAEVAATVAEYLKRAPALQTDSSPSSASSASSLMRRRASRSLVRGA